MLLTNRQAIIFLLFTLLIWFTGYLTGAKVTRILEGTRVIYDCIRLAAPEDATQV